MHKPGALERAIGMVKFQCPQCAVEGHDKHKDNAGLFVHDGKWGCAFASSDSALGRAHWEAIGHALGAFNGHHQRPVVAGEPPTTNAQNNQLIIMSTT